ncbi:MAG: phospholipid-binding protein [Planctomycetota bacterium]
MNPVSKFYRATSAPIHGPQPDGLAERIQERIERRLGPRIHDLKVSIDGKTIRIDGRCATYYSKQLAQHAALGVIEDEQLDNAIEVAIAR